MEYFKVTNKHTNFTYIILFALISTSYIYDYPVKPLLLQCILSYIY